MTGARANNGESGGGGGGGGGGMGGVGWMHVKGYAIKRVGFMFQG